ncbi:NAD(P)/FAD-dependent oxidoreductase [Legionella worsleiensis]|jgi:thioredoxin reductase (NADPH)|uniref:NAD(P)/FAD-dependent oxidoreductase n=1 Tax=Legionella worsleiensis TaxID=45076 RepID=UPI000E074A7A|nr:NAD(P)/FAD-dependent oxidoreductase [Legionella worsleiensis]STY50040.1 thioredoxin reductase [Legionella worsleiensis]HAU1024991.1 NAD(P)/FAD-dependent oxidoreductase [Legionella pneumophila]
MKILDCIIIGGGPAGLVAGMYLARFRREVMIFDTLNSRASYIPMSHNYPGFARVISGMTILKRLKQQLGSYNVPFINEKVESISKNSSDNFIIQSDNETKSARNVILATGISDYEPHFINLHAGLKRGLIRHCPVCDAYEVMNKKIAVIGNAKKGLEECMFLRHYTSQITLITLDNRNNWSTQDQKKIKDANIKIISNNITHIKLLKNTLEITLEDNNTLTFDSLYSAMGCKKNNDLAQSLNAKIKKGELIVDTHQQTSVKGLFAAGDIVSGLNQICVAQAQGAIAATAIHKRLSE